MMSVVILLSFGFTPIKVLSLGPEDSFFVEQIRPRLAEFPKARELFGLHNDGEAFTDYLSSRFETILIEVDSLESIEPHGPSLELFAEKVQEITGKEVLLEYSDLTIENYTPISETRVDTLIERHRSYREPFDKTAVLYIFYASTDELNDHLLGITHQEDAFIMYKTSIQELTKDVPAVEDEFEYSTLLHEFGHQIGLGHNTDEQCLMFAREGIEEEPQVISSEEDVVVDFCVDELVELEAIKRSL